MLDTRKKAKNFRSLVDNSSPLQVVGVINAYTALLAEKNGVKSIYLSGAGVANACFGKPDLGLTSLSDVVNEVERITQVSNLPILVDGDTGWGSELNAEYTVQKLIAAGASAVHLEDQQWPKRCGHRDGKSLIPKEEMTLKLSVACKARGDLMPEFVIMARTDACSVEGIDSAIERAKAYVDAGADMIFAEAIASLDDYKKFTSSINVPILANITEFGKTPMFTVGELKQAGIKMALYPLSGFRAMSKAAEDTFKTIVTEGTQASMLDDMQTREELYEVLNYKDYESRIKG